MTHRDRTTDVLVVGGGAAGLMAAATAVEHNDTLRVAVLEKDTRMGSSAEIGSGTIMAAGTRLQAAAGVDDSPEAFLADITAKAGGSNNPAVTLAVCQESAQVVHWFLDVVGVPLELATEVRRAGLTGVRAHAHPTRSGRPLIGALREWVRQHPRIDFLDALSGTDLVIDDRGRVVGVATSDGTVIHAAGVVLAAGGFGADPETLARHIPEVADFPYIGAAGHTGEGLQWGRKVGAATEHLAGYQGHGYYHPTGGTRINPGLVMAGGIMVNQEGRRFEREDQGYSEWARPVSRQPGGIAVALWDDRIDALYAHSQSMIDTYAAGVVVQAEDLDEIARAFELPPRTLRDTVEAYNAGVEAGTDALGRKVLTEPLRPGFRATIVSGAIAQTLGGLRVDDRARVLRDDGTSVPGLFAAGTTAAGVSGNDPGGYLSGSGLLMAFGLGRLAGKELARVVQPEHVA